MVIKEADSSSSCYDVKEEYFGRNELVLQTYKGTVQQIFQSLDFAQTGGGEFKQNCIKKILKRT